MRSLLVATLLVAAALAGCITPPDSDAAKRDAPPAAATPTPTPAPAREPQTVTVDGNFGGTHSEYKKIEVPPGITSLRVDASWSIGGSAYFKLVRPGGAIAKDDRITGGASRPAGEWYVVENPKPGIWEFTAQASGGGSYRFDFTY